VIGATIGNFEVIRRLGKGGMGEVWLAEHKGVRTKVAIKTLVAKLSDDEQQIKRFHNEAVAVGKIKHSGITKIFDVGFLPTGEAYLVMEFLEGESLAARIARVGRLRVRELAEITRQIASVLQATHAEGITHRDLKPDNLFLVHDADLPRGERVKVLDFGIAKRVDGTAMTGSGAIGTPLYMSPEQWKTPGTVDGRADIYSLGCIAFEMASGRPPFVAETVGQACTMHLQDPVPSLRERAPQVPAEVDAIVRRMLAKEPGDRPTPREVRDVFGELAERAEPEGSAPTLPDGSPVPASAATAASLAPLPQSAPISTTLGSAASMVSARGEKPRRWWPAATAVAVGVATIVVGIIVMRPSAHESAPPAPAPSPPPSAPEPAPAPTPEAPSESHIRVITTPATAELRIDDAVVKNPFDGGFPRNDVNHHITITAPGFQPRSELVTFDQDRTLKYELARATQRPATPTGPTYYRGTKGTVIGPPGAP
jgi:serine/threonine-protein kinase